MMKTVWPGTWMQFGLLLSCVATTVVLVYFFTRRKHFFVKPSITFVALFNVFIQWPVYFNFADISTCLDRTLLHVIATVSLFPLLTIGASLMCGAHSAKCVFERLPTCVVPGYWVDVLLGSVATLCAICYFMYVPFRSTGLFSILSGADSLTNSLAREESFKLLPALPRYAQAFGSAVCGNMLAVVASHRAYGVIRHGSGPIRAIAIVYALVCVCAAVLFAAVSGARGPAAVTILGVIVFFALRVKLKVSVRAGLCALVVVLLIPFALQYMRADDKTLIGTIEAISNRLFSVRIMAGIYTIEYAEHYGYFGVGGIPRLAMLLGAEPINVANVVARYILPASPIESALANCSFVFSYYAYFGIIALPVSVVLVLALDMFVWMIQKLVPSAITCLAITGLIVPMTDLTNIDYTIVLFSKGIIPWLAICILIGQLSRQKRKPM